MVNTMETSIFTDKRVNRDITMGKCNSICVEYANKVTGQHRAFGAGEMTYDNYTSTSWKRDRFDIQVKVILDFNLHSVTVETKA